MSSMSCLVCFNSSFSSNPHIFFFFSRLSSLSSFFPSFLPLPFFAFSKTDTHTHTHTYIHTGLVRTSFFTTLLQAFSRVFLVWAIAPASPASHSSPFYALMISSWAVAEITRYSFHVAAATFPAGQVPKLLVWARYNFFFVLYLTGAGSEWVCMWKALPVMREWKDKDGGFGSIGSLSYWTVMVMLVAWPCCRCSLISIFIFRPPPHPPWTCGWSNMLTILR